MKNLVNQYYGFWLPIFPTSIYKIINLTQQIPGLWSSSATRRTTVAYKATDVTNTRQSLIAPILLFGKVRRKGRC